MAAFPHPDLTPIQAEAIDILGEECNELAQECSKLLRFGFDPVRVDGTNHRLPFLKEKIDVQLLMVIVELLLDRPSELNSETYVDYKVDRLARYSSLGDVALVAGQEVKCL